MFDRVNGSCRPRPVRRGPVGHPTQGARRLQTLNVVRRRSAVEDILALGGTAVICTEDEDLRERVADIAGHDGVKAIDCVSGQVGADVSRALAPHGELVVYGALSTAKPVRQAHYPRLRALADL